MHNLIKSDQHFRILDQYSIIRDNNREDEYNFENSMLQSQKNLMALDKIKDIINISEKKIKKIASDVFVKSGNDRVYLSSPSHFDENFNQRSYIRELVRAKIYGLSVIREDETPNVLKKHKLLQRNVTGIKNVYTTEQFKDNEGCEYEERKMADSSLVFMKDVSDKKSSRNVLLYESKRISERQLKKIGIDTKLSVQNLPNINIRPELIERKSLLIDINPDDKDNIVIDKKDNVVIVQSKYCEIENEKMVDNSDSCHEIEKRHSNVDIKDDNQIKVVKLSLENAKDKLDLSLSDSELGLTSNILKNEANSSKNHFIFINENNMVHSDSDLLQKCVRKKKVSTLKKFGIPEIQKIYNPKGSTEYKYTGPKKSSNMHRLSAQGLIYKYSQTTDRHVFINSKTSNKGKSMNKSNVSVEYIPYSKLTVGGLKFKDVKDDTVQSNEDFVKDEISKDQKPNIEEDFTLDLSNINKATQTTSKYIGNMVKDMRIVNMSIDIDKHVDSTDSDIDIPDKEEIKALASKDTQTPQQRTIDVMTSPTRMTTRSLSPIFDQLPIDASTSPMYLKSPNETIDKSRFKVKFPTDSDTNGNKKSTVKGDVSSDSYVESESSEVQSLGEINLKILRKKLIKILEESNSSISNTSTTTSINSDIPRNSTVSSYKKSDGELSIRISSKKL